MAVLIPSDLKRAPDISVGEVQAGEQLQSALSDDTWIWYNSPRYSDRSRFVVLSPSYGVLAIDVYDWSPSGIEVRRDLVIVDGKTLDPAGDLARRIEDLREQTRALSWRPQFAGRILLSNFSDDDLAPLVRSQYFDRSWLLTRNDLAAPSILNLIPAPAGGQLDAPRFLELRAQLYPDTEFAKSRMVHDEDGAARIRVRLLLDSQQEDAARSLGSEVTIVRGPSGSGKSLVLAARARLVSLRQPDWTIQVLCYNRTLVGYLRVLIGDYDNVHIETVYSWLKGLKANIDPEDERSVREALARGASGDLCDAMLIDEAQDFAPSWLELAAGSVRADRAGAIIAIDEAQSIYREVAPHELFGNGNVRTITLTRSYRSTVQIGRFALESVFGLESDGFLSGPSRRPSMPTFHSSGPKVQLVYATSWNAQADFIAEAIEWLVESRRATYPDIAVLFPQNRGIVSRIIPRLEQREIPYFWVNRDAKAKASVDLSEDSVKISTVHSCKGMEFPIVFLFGLEALDVPEHIQAADIDDANRTRVAYVAMTRAQDLLFITYTRPNTVIDRALDLGEWAESKVYPTDFRSDADMTWHV